MEPTDLSAVEELSAEAFLHSDRARTGPGDAEPVRRSPEKTRAWLARTEHLIRHDGPGCWVAEVAPGSPPVGMVTSLVREGTWMLATFAVSPELQSRGLGAWLLQHALGHGDPEGRAMLSGSPDPRAAHRYLAAGFDLHPQLELRGLVDRSAIPAGAAAAVRPGDDADLDLLEAADRATRGVSRGVDHPLLRGMHDLIVTDEHHGPGSGYAYLDLSGQVLALAATTDQAAERLLWAALAAAPADRVWALRHVTAANPWAIRIGDRAGLSLSTRGYLGLRRMAPPQRYLHHGSLL